MCETRVYSCITTLWGWTTTTTGEEELGKDSPVWHGFSSLPLYTQGMNDEQVTLIGVGLRKKCGWFTVTVWLHKFLSRQTVMWLLSPTQLSVYILHTFYIYRQLSIQHLAWQNNIHIFPIQLSHTHTHSLILLMMTQGMHVILIVILSFLMHNYYQKYEGIRIRSYWKFREILEGAVVLLWPHHKIVCVLLVTAD